MSFDTLPVDTAGSRHAGRSLHIREMTADDVPAAAAVLDAGGWRGREAFFRKALTIPSCLPLVGLLDGEIAATGMATVNGRVGWVGTIFVDRRLRRQGLGRAITEAVCERLEAAGCDTLALIASEFGQPVYEQMGFRVDAQLQFFTAPRAEAETPPPPGFQLRSARPDDLAAILALDARASGEDRRALLDAADVHVLAAADGTAGTDGLGARDHVRGFLATIDPHWAAVIADDDAAAVALLDRVRVLAPDRGRAVVSCDRDDACALLVERGWEPELQSPRMLRGAAATWQPGLVWGIFGRAFG